MRRRITVWVLVLVALTLVLTTAGSYYLIRRATVTTAVQELAGQARASARTISKAPDVTLKPFRRELTLIGEAGSFDGIDVVKLYPDGTIVGGLPSGLTPADLDVPRLQQGNETSGHIADQLAYAAVPTPLERANGFVPVLVITRQIRNPAVGLRYFVLVGAIALLIAALVAAGLARRLTRPLVAAVRTTHRIASGDLDATVPVGRHDDPEFAELAESINAMGANLVRARDQERQFILSVSHELRTPLTSIRGYAEAIVDGTAEDASGAAVVISAEASRLERLVQDLLDLARLDADRFSLELGPVDAASLSRQVADGFRPRAGSLGLELAAGGSAGPLWVTADPDRLAQVLANLVENASSFAGRRIEIGAGGDPDRPVVWVADDGPGIPAGQLAQVFERHFVSDRVSGRRVGSGLGLAIVAELAQAMGASVRAESPVAAGRGTRMVVALAPSPPPRTDPDPGAAVPVAPPTPPATGRRPLSVPPLAGEPAEPADNAAFPGGRALPP